MGGPDRPWRTPSRLHEGVTFLARDDQGSLHAFSFIRAVAERKGRFRIHSMRD